MGCPHLEHVSNETPIGSQCLRSRYSDVINSSTCLFPQPGLRRGYRLLVAEVAGWFPNRRHHLLRSLPLHLLRLHPPTAWRTAAAGPSSVALCGPAGSEIWAEPLGTCSVAAGRSDSLGRRRAVRWPQQSAALHCSREGPVQKCQLH